MEPIGVPADVQRHYPPSVRPRDYLVWFAFVGSIALIFVVGEIANESWASQLVVGLGGVVLGMLTFLRGEIIDLMHYKTNGQRSYARSDPRYAERVTKLEQSRKLLRILVPPFLVFWGVIMVLSAVGWLN